MKVPDHYRRTAELIGTLRARSFGNAVDRRWNELERLALARTDRTAGTLYFWGTAQPGTRTQLHSLLIQLWTAAGCHIEYRKEDWVELQTLLFGVLNRFHDCFDNPDRRQI